jgi:nucleoporin POM152
MVQAVVDLVGTPPFDFEWHRYKLVWDQNKKRHYKGEVLESHNVYGIEEHRYYINTSVEGIIEVSHLLFYGVLY